MKFVIVVIVALFVAGCGLTPYGDVAREAVRIQGAKVADAGLANAEWFICNAATTGAVQRRYGPHPDLMAAYTKICDANRARQVPVNDDASSTGTAAPINVLPVP